MVGYIVGKGESLEYLTKDYFGEGIVFTINEAILKVELLNLDNKIYSVQKDGSSPEFRNTCPSKDCLNCPYSMVYPQDATLLVHEHESKYCLEDYYDRHIFDNELMGLNWFDQSAQSCIKLAQQKGCTELILLCFDSVTNGSDVSIYNTSEISGEVLGGGKIRRAEYKRGVHALKRQLEGIKHEFIEPKP